MNKMQQSSASPAPPGMTAKQAKTAELTIVGISLLSLVLLFQPFSLELYSVGAGLVVFAGLAFNLVPLCVPGRPFASLLRGALVVAIIFVVVTLLALGSAMLYSIYLAGG
jgi:hypothetical protein